MKITILEKTLWQDIEQGIRQTPLLHERNGIILHPYEHAVITLKACSYENTLPTSLYAAQDMLDVQEHIAQNIAREGYDALELEGGLILDSVNIKGEPIRLGLIPPIVEETAEDGAYIIDGLHRTYRGFLAGRETFMAIHVTNIRSDCPSYAYPNAWKDVVVYPHTPEDRALRKHYREGDVYALYRDFSALNGSKPRGK